jgi:DNA-binding GntR family transcriptional regulator
MVSGVYDAIKQRIVLLELKPGSPISITSLAKELAVSVTPVREALIRLETDGLVHRVPSGTALVTEVHLRDLQYVLEARLLLVEQIARLAMQRITDSELVGMQELLAKMQKATDRRELIKLDSEFHQLINDASKNPVLTKLASFMRNHIARLWYYVSNEQSYWTELIDGRAALIQAFENRDVEEATRLLQSHITMFIDRVRSSMWGDHVEQ